MDQGHVIQSDAAQVMLRSRGMASVEWSRSLLFAFGEWSIGEIWVAGGPAAATFKAIKHGDGWRWPGLGDGDHGGSRACALVRGPLNIHNLREREWVERLLSLQLRRFDLHGENPLFPVSFRTKRHAFKKCGPWLELASNQVKKAIEDGSTECEHSVAAGKMKRLLKFR